MIIGQSVIVRIRIRIIGMGCQQTKIRELSDEDIEFLKSHTKYDEQTIREWYEGFKIDCPNGKLSRKKFIDIYRTFFPTGNPEKFCDHVFRTFDTDNSGHIDFKEFLMAIGITASNSGEERLKWAFRMYDINNDGGIEIAEMTKIVKVSLIPYSFEIRAIPSQIEFTECDTG